MRCLVVPVNDVADGYNYPPEVRFEIPEQDLPSYVRAADFLNITDVDVVCVEHEFGIFGGPAGSHVLALLRELQMPIVTTLHTVYRESWRNPAGKLKRASELGRRDAHHAAEGSRELAWAGVAHFQLYIDKAARGFTNHQLGAGDPLAAMRCSGVMPVAI